MNSLNNKQLEIYKNLNKKSQDLFVELVEGSKTDEAGSTGGTAGRKKRNEIMSIYENNEIFQTEMGVLFNKSSTGFGNVIKSSDEKYGKHYKRNKTKRYANNRIIFYENQGQKKMNDEILKSYCEYYGKNFEGKYFYNQIEYIVRGEKMYKQGKQNAKKVHGTLEQIEELLGNKELVNQVRFINNYSKKGKGGLIYRKNRLLEEKNKEAQKKPSMGLNEKLTFEKVEVSKEEEENEKILAKIIGEENVNKSLPKPVVNSIKELEELPQKEDTMVLNEKETKNYGEYAIVILLIIDILVQVIK